MMDRRRFLSRAGGAALASLVGMDVGAGRHPGRPGPDVQAGARELVRPPRLRAGSTVGLVAPAGIVAEAFDVQLAREMLAALGLKTKLGRHALDRHGYFAGTDEDRAADLMAMFEDPDVDGLVALRGGWGAARLLDRLDYALIRERPKVLVGYSDVTALLLAIYAKSGLVTFHGPDALSSWTSFTAGGFQRTFLGAEATTLANPRREGDALVQTADRVRTITPGVARGRLVGGNLTIFTSLIGTPYLPDVRGHILFLEDIGEAIYRVDRMLTQLGQAGVLGQLAGFVFGKCTRCDHDSDFGLFTLAEVIDSHISSLGIPAWQGAMIGHVPDQHTVPLGVEAEIDAERGTITLLEPAVV